MSGTRRAAMLAASMLMGLVGVSAHTVAKEKGAASDCDRACLQGHLDPRYGFAAEAYGAMLHERVLASASVSTQTEVPVVMSVFPCWLKPLREQT